MPDSALLKSRTKKCMYLIILTCAIFASVLFGYINHKSRQGEIDATFQRNYLVVYTLAYFADWLNGPYVYALYESYGLSEHEIAILFLTGFGTSALCGPFVGILADNVGRKKCSILYFVIYALSSICKPFDNFNVLLLGRVFGGLGTSLLTTALESWLVGEHIRLKYPDSMLQDTFAKATLCNSTSAVVAGLIAQWLADAYGYVAPFVFAILPLVLGALYCQMKWANDIIDHTERSCSMDLLDNINSNIIILGVTQSLFLGSMFTFVFLWTPAMDTVSHQVPYGMIFAIFMAMISLGSNIFQYMSKRIETLVYWILGGSALAMIMSTMAIGNEYHLLFAFCMFEMICGIMFPTYGSLRSKYIPDKQRTTIMNIYRIPLNLFVVVILLNKKNMSLQLTFGICSLALACSMFLWQYFQPVSKTLHGHQYEKANQVDEEEDFGDVEDEEC